MFGYVSIQKPELKIKEYYRYKGYYCGLCKQLKEEYGRIGQMTLTYDMTFLIVLLTSLYEVNTTYEEERCMVHPTKKHPVLINEITQYAADMNVALTYHHFQDDWNDDQSITGWVGSRLFLRKYRAIEKKYPRQCRVIQECLSQLQQLEQSACMDLDVVAGCFGTLMGELFIYKEDIWEPTLRRFGYQLGKFIYLMDAYEDLQDDRIKHRYNPLIQLAEEEQYEETCKQFLELIMADCVKEFEKLPLILDVEILRNIMYAGVWTKYERLQEKKNSNRKEEYENDRSI